MAVFSSGTPVLLPLSPLCFVFIAVVVVAVVVELVEPRMEAIEKAYLERDFATFGKITMQDSNQFHAVCLDTHPPIFYMNDVSRCDNRERTCLPCCWRWGRVGVR